MINLNKSLNILLAISVLFGILFRLYNINYDNLWFDEIATFWVTDPNISLTDMFERNRTTEGAPYFYYILVYYLHKIFGYDPNIGRYFSSFLGIISIFSVSYLCSLLNKNNSYKFSIFLVSFNVYLIAYSAEFRSYMLLFFSTSMTLIFIIKYLNNIKDSHNSYFYLILLSLIQIINVIIHPFSFIVFFSICLFLLINFFKNKIVYKELNYSMLITFIIISIITFYYYFGIQIISDFNFVTQPGIKFYTNFYFSKFFGSRLLGIIHLLIFIYLLFKFKKIIFNFKHPSALLFILIVLSYALPILFGIYKPILVPRYIIFVLIPIIVLLSFFICEIENNLIKSSLIIIIVIITSLNQLTESNVKQFFKERNFYKPQFTEGLSYINQSSNKNYAVLVSFSNSSYNKKYFEEVYLNYFSNISKKQNLNLIPFKFEDIDNKINGFWILCSTLVNKNCEKSEKNIQLSNTVKEEKTFNNLIMKLIYLN